MDRNEAEARIARLLREIKGVVDEYGGTSGYLSLTLYPKWDGSHMAIRFNNQHWSGGEDEDRPLDFFESEEEEEEEE